MRAANERLVCVALTGYGLTGPYADRPAYDYVIQALTGIMALTGDPDAPPTKPGYSLVDNSSGIMGAVGLLAKIIEGKGGQVDISLYDVMLSQLNYLAAAYLNAGERPQRHRNGAHPYFVPAQIFASRDGHLALFISHDGFWQRFAEEVERPHWLSDPRFTTMEARNANRDLVITEVAALLQTDTTVRWVQRLSRLGIVVAGIVITSYSIHYTKLYEPVNDIRSGLGGKRGICTERHANRLIPNTTRTFSDTGDCG